MWRVFESKSVQKQIKKCPARIREEYEAWKLLVQHSGPACLKAISGYRDHALKGQWQSARSSYLNRQWRLIYFANKDQVSVYVLEVTPHDYRKKS